MRRADISSQRAGCTTAATGIASWPDACSMRCSQTNSFQTQTTRYRREAIATNARKTSRRGDAYCDFGFVGGTTPTGRRHLR